MQSNFKLVSEMNKAFGNPKGDPRNIDWERVRKQCISIGHEFVELLTALGGTGIEVTQVLKAIDNVKFKYNPDLNGVRDALCDAHVFAYGAHHLMGINADVDMESVVSAVNSRFIKGPEDLETTLCQLAAKGVNRVYAQGEYPRMILKSAEDQPDAPKDKFLKAASYHQPDFYDPIKYETDK